MINALTNTDQLLTITPTIVEAIKDNNLLTIVGCSKSKIWDTFKEEEKSKYKFTAENAYKGPLFTQFLNFKKIVEEKNYNLKWKIFSAKYGLILPTDEIEDYNISFAEKFSAEMNNFIRDLEIYAMVHKTLLHEEEFKDTKVILIWAGKEYVDRLENALDKIKREYLQYLKLKIFAPATKLKIGVSLGMMKMFNTIIKNQLPEKS